MLSDIRPFMASPSIEAADERLSSWRPRKNCASFIWPAPNGA